MTGAAFISHLRMIFGGSYDRAQKHGTALRDMGLFPDARHSGHEAHVTCTQAASAIVLFAADPTPRTDTYEVVAKSYLSLVEAVDCIALLLRNAGMNIYSEGVARVSVSHARPFIAVVYEDPQIKKVLSDSGSPNWRVEENEKTFGIPEGKRSVEAFTFVKRSALMELSQALSYTGLLNQEAADQLLTHINA